MFRWARSSAVKVEAYQLLKLRQCDVGVVYNCDRDSILYITSKGKPRTAWIKVDEHGLITSVQVMTGFQVEPPPDWRNG